MITGRRNGSMPTHYKDPRYECLIVQKRSVKLQSLNRALNVRQWWRWPKRGKERCTTILQPPRCEAVLPPIVDDCDDRQKSVALKLTKKGLEVAMKAHLRKMKISGYEGSPENALRLWYHVERNDFLIFVCCFHWINRVVIHIGMETKTLIKSPSYLQSHPPNCSPNYLQLNPFKISIYNIHKSRPTLIKSWFWQ